MPAVLPFLENLPKEIETPYLQPIILVGKHYLYRHIRKDKNEPFYIGIGTKYQRHKYNHSRANAIHSANCIWLKIIAKSEYEVEILMESDNYEFIKQKEVEFIKLYGRIDLGTGTLANLTDGGEGIVGNICTEERKQKIGLANKGKKYYGEKNPFYGKKMSEELKAKLLEINRTRDKSKDNRENNKRKVVDLNNNITYKSVTELADKIGLTRDGLYRRFGTVKVIKENGVRRREKRDNKDLIVKIKGIDYKYL